MTAQRRTLLLRMLAISSLQAAALFLLAQAEVAEIWPATQPHWSVPLWVLAIAWPVMLLLSIGTGPVRRPMAGAGAVAAVLALLGMYTGWQITPTTEPGEVLFSAGFPDGTRATMPVGSIIAAMVISLGVAAFKALMYLQPLTAREPVTYAALFRQSWRNLLVAGLAWAMAVGVCLVLMMWAMLLSILGVRFFRIAFMEPRFFLPLLALGFGAGAFIFRGLEGTIDTLTRLIEGSLRLLLPLLVALLTAFLATLPFTGLDPLWDVGSGTGLLMALNVLALASLNAVYQTGERRPYPLAVHRLVYAATVLLPVISGLALYGMALRIGQYGFTVERCWALSICALLALFSTGYAASIVWRRDAWQGSLARVNRAMGLVVLAVLLLANSPLMDFRKISLASQQARVARSEIELDQFDFYYARQHLGRPAWLWMEATLVEVEADDPRLAELIRNPRMAMPPEFAGAVAGAGGAGATAASFRERLVLRPEPFEIPAGLEPHLDEFLGQPRFFRTGGDDPNLAPVLIAVDLDRDGTREYVLVASYFGGARGFRMADGEWDAFNLMFSPDYMAQGRLALVGAGGAVFGGPAPAIAGDPRLVAPPLRFEFEEAVEQLLDGPIDTVEPEFQELRIGDLRLIAVD